MKIQHVQHHRARTLGVSIYESVCTPCISCIHHKVSRALIASTFVHTWYMLCFVSTVCNFLLHGFFKRQKQSYLYWKVHQIISTNKFVVCDIYVLWNNFNFQLINDNASILFHLTWTSQSYHIEFYNLWKFSRYIYQSWFLW